MEDVIRESTMGRILSVWDDDIESKAHRFESASWRSAIWAFCLDRNYAGTKLGECG